MEGSDPMIFGKTTKEKNAVKYNWQEVFIIWPRRLINGRWAMFETVERCNYFAPHIPCAASFSLFNWCYREITDAA